jgi:hypothetical protein
MPGVTAWPLRPAICFALLSRNCSPYSSLSSRSTSSTIGPVCRIAALSWSCVTPILPTSIGAREFVNIDAVAIISILRIVCHALDSATRPARAS